MKIPAFVSKIPVIKNRLPIQAKDIPAQIYPPEEMDYLEKSFFEHKRRFENEKLSKQFFRNFDYFSVRDYDNLSETELENVRGICDSSCESAVRDNVEMGLKLKKHLDDEYGENKYVFVSVGTSPTGIARVLEFSGVETKYLPLSDLRSDKSPAQISSIANKLPLYSEFLREQGITQEKIEKSDKKYLFFDYTSTGDSLTNFEKLMKQGFKIDSDNISYLSLNDELVKSIDRESDEDVYNLASYIQRALYLEGIEKYSNVSHLPITSLEKIKRCKNFKSISSNMFNFLLIDALKRK